MGESVPIYDDPLTGLGMEEVTPAAEMDEFLSQFLPVFDAPLTELVGESMDWTEDGNPLSGWETEDKLSLLRELALSHIFQSQQGGVVAVPWSQLFFDELAVGVTSGLRGYFLGYVGSPRSEEGQAIVAERIATWSESAVEVLIAWMEGEIE